MFVSPFHCDGFRVSWFPCPKSRRASSNEPPDHLCAGWWRRWRRWSNAAAAANGPDAANGDKHWRKAASETEAEKARERQRPADHLSRQMI